MIERKEGVDAAFGKGAVYGEDAVEFFRRFLLPGKEAVPAGSGLYGCRVHVRGVLLQRHFAFACFKVFHVSVLP